MIVSLTNQKGGAGKTTICACLAAIPASAGFSTAIIDLDPQASLYDWCQVRNNNPEVNNIEAHFVPQSAIESKTAELQSKGVEFIFIDTPPHNSAAMTGAIEAADVVLMPVKPSALDIKASKVTAKAIQQIGAKAAFLLNEYDYAASTDIQDQARSIMLAARLPIIGVIGRRVDFKYCIPSGLGVVEYAPSSKAAQEIKSLWNTLMQFHKTGEISG